MLTVPRELGAARYGLGVAEEDIVGDCGGRETRRGEGERKKIGKINAVSDHCYLI